MQPAGSCLSLELATYETPSVDDLFDVDPARPRRLQLRTKSSKCDCPGTIFVYRRAMDNDQQVIALREFAHVPVSVARLTCRGCCSSLCLKAMHANHVGQVECQNGVLADLTGVHPDILGLPVPFFARARCRVCVSTRCSFFLSRSLTPSLPASAPLPPLFSLFSLAPTHSLTRWGTQLHSSPLRCWTQTIRIIARTHASQTAARRNRIPSSSCTTCPRRGSSYTSQPSPGPTPATVRKSDSMSGAGKMTVGGRQTISRAVGGRRTLS